MKNYLSIRALGLGVLLAAAWLTAGRASAAAPAAASNAEIVLPVLCYHKFGPEKPRDDYQMSPRRFEEQLAYLKKNGYTYLSLTQVAAFVDGTLNPVPKRPFCLTVDDGWDSGFYIAAPLLKKYGFRAVFMVVTSTQEWKKRITWAMMKKMEKDGFEFGCHSWAHSKLFRPEKGETVAAYRLRLKKELVDSKAVMEAKLGHAVTTLAYPFGGYNLTVEDFARRAGYKLIFTVTRGSVRLGDNPLRLKRLMLLSHPGMGVFAGFLNLKPLPVTLQGLQDGGAFEYASAPLVLTLNPGVSFDSNQLQAGVDGRPIHFEKKGAVLVSRMPPGVKPGLHFLHAGLKTAGEEYEARWLFQVYFKQWGKYFLPEKKQSSGPPRPGK